MVWDRRNVISLDDFIVTQFEYFCEFPSIDCITRLKSQSKRTTENECRTNIRSNEILLLATLLFGASHIVVFSHACCSRSSCMVSCWWPEQQTNCLQSTKNLCNLRATDRTERATPISLPTAKLCHRWMNVRMNYSTSIENTRAENASRRKWMNKNKFTYYMLSVR